VGGIPARGFPIRFAQLVQPGRRFPEGRPEDRFRRGREGPGGKTRPDLGPRACERTSHRCRRAAGFSSARSSAALEPDDPVPGRARRRSRTSCKRSVSVRARYQPDRRNGDSFRSPSPARPISLMGRKRTADDSLSTRPPPLGQCPGVTDNSALDGFVSVQHMQVVPAAERMPDADLRLVRRSAR
jgi:hypothetical protein